MRPCWFQIVSTHFNARPTRREIRNVIFVERNHWECSQVAGKIQGAFQFFLKIQQTLSAKACLMKFLFILIISVVAIWNEAGRACGKSILSSVCAICCRCGWCGPNKNPSAAKSAWRETYFGKSSLILEDQSAGLN